MPDAKKHKKARVERAVMRERLGVLQPQQAVEKLLR